MKVREERVAEYRAHHEVVWPEMLEALSKHGWRNYSLFLGKDGLLFGYFEADESLRASLDGMSHEDANRRWQEMMEPFFEIPPGSRPDEMMVELEQVFHLP